jgi:hypothetical protein
MNPYMIYVTGPNVDIRLPTLMLETERLPYQIVVDPRRVMELTNGAVNPTNGWVVYDPIDNNGRVWPHKWHQLAKFLIDQGLILC